MHHLRFATEADYQAYMQRLLARVVSAEAPRLERKDDVSASRLHTTAPVRLRPDDAS